MLVESLFCQRDVRVVPAVPVARLVARDQQDSASRRIEDEQDSHFARSGRARSELFHVVVTRSFDAIHERSPQLGTSLRQKVDGTLDQVCGHRVRLSQVKQPAADLWMQFYLPHVVNITLALFLPA